MLKRPRVDYIANCELVWFCYLLSVSVLLLLVLVRSDDFLLINKSDIIIYQMKGLIMRNKTQQISKWYLNSFKSYACYTNIGVTMMCCQNMRTGSVRAWLFYPKQKLCYYISNKRSDHEKQNAAHFKMISQLHQKLCSLYRSGDHSNDDKMWLLFGDSWCTGQLDNVELIRQCHTSYNNIQLIHQCHNLF